MSLNKLNAASREYLSLTITADTDLSPATLLVSVDDGTYEAWAWVAQPVQTGSTWTRTARRLVAGPDAVPGTALVLVLGRHSTMWRLTGIEPEQPARTSDPIDVA